MDERVPNVFYFHVLLSFRTNKFQDGTNIISGCIYYDCYPYTMQKKTFEIPKKRGHWHFKINFWKKKFYFEMLRSPLFGIKNVFFLQ